MNQKTKTSQNVSARRILGIDASERSFQVGLISDSEDGQARASGVAENSEGLLDCIRLLFEEREITLEDLSAIAVCSGPGSFTGLRSALATASGLVFGKAIPVIPVGTLELRLYGLLMSQREADRSASSRPDLSRSLLPFMVANRTEYFCLPILLEAPSSRIRERNVSESFRRIVLPSLGEFAIGVDSPLVVECSDPSELDARLLAAIREYDAGDFIRDFAVSPECLSVDMGDSDFQAIAGGQLGIWAAAFALEFFDPAEESSVAQPLEICYGKPVSAKTLAERRALREIG